MVTDYAEYFIEIQERIAQQTDLKLVAHETDNYQHITTNFENKYQLEGRKIYRAVYGMV